MHFESPIKRRKSRQIMIGNVAVGGDAPISVQSMMARGMSRVGSRVSSESVETASKPRNDRHRMAAPARIAFGNATTLSNG